MARYASQDKALERMIVTYLHPRVYKMFMANKVRHFQHGNSTHAHYIISKFFDDMSEVQQQQLIDDYDKNPKNKKL